MISDNWSTYMSAAAELCSLMEKTEVKEELGRRGVTWRFIPLVWERLGLTGKKRCNLDIHTQASPLVWERLVGLTKTAINKVLGRRPSFGNYFCGN